MSAHDTIRTNHAGKHAAAKRDGRHEKANAPTEPYAIPDCPAAILAAAPHLVAALRELVLLKDLKTTANGDADLLAVYERRKPRAWAAARAALAQAEGRA